MIKQTVAGALLLAAGSMMTHAAAGQSAASASGTLRLAAVAEKSPPGDIPDNQAFVTFKSPLGFSVKVPEGWARRDLSNGVSFRDKYNEVQVAVSARPSPPTLASLKQNEVPALEGSQNAIRVSSVKALSLPAGPVFVVQYSAISDPTAVTNKRLSLDAVRYYFWKAGRLATLTLSTPAGADNADQWRLMATSFVWQ